MKSVPLTAVPEPIVTATHVASSRAMPLSSAVTVIAVADAPSSTVSGLTDSLTAFEAASSSFTVTATSAAVSDP